MFAPHLDRLTPMPDLAIADQHVGGNHLLWAVPQYQARSTQLSMNMPLQVVAPSTPRSSSPDHLAEDLTSSSSSPPQPAPSTGKAGEVRLVLKCLKHFKSRPLRQAIRDEIKKVLGNLVRLGDANKIHEAIVELARKRVFKKAGVLELALEKQFQDFIKALKKDYVHQQLTKYYSKSVHLVRAKTESDDKKTTPQTPKQEVVLQQQKPDQHPTQTPQQPTVPMDPNAAAHMQAAHMLWPPQQSVLLSTPFGSDWALFTLPPDPYCQVNNIVCPMPMLPYSVEHNL